MMPKAISYIRFSSGQQAKGSTTERQQALIHAWLEEHPDVKLSNLSQKDLGRSGFKGEHLSHGLGRILEAIREGKISEGDYILVEAVDRIGRLDTLEMLRLIQDILTANVTIVTLEDKQEYTRQSLNENIAAPYILIGKIQQASEYSRNLSRRIKASYESKRRSARQGNVIRKNNPFWLTTSGKIIPDRGEAVQKSIGLYLKGYGTRKIIIDLSEEHNSLINIHPSTLKRWFNNRALIGEWDNQGDHIQDVFEPLIDLKTFYKLQSEIKHRSKEMSPEQTYALSGLVECQMCTKRFYFRTKNHKGNKIIYSNCSTYLKRGKPYCSNNKTWPYEVLRTIFEMTFDEHLSIEATENATNHIIKDLEELKGKKAEIDEKIISLLQVLETAPGQRHTLDRIASLNDELKPLEDKIAAKELSIRNGDMLDDITEESYMEYANANMYEIASDQVALREVLKKKGYRISILGNIATVMVGPAGLQEYSLVKRSSKYKCYLVKLRIPEHEILPADEDDEVAVYPEFTKIMAINKTGVICSTEGEKEIYDLLSLREDDSPMEYIFGENIEFLNPAYNEEMAEHVAWLLGDN